LTDSGHVVDAVTAVCSVCGNDHGLHGQYKFDILPPEITRKTLPRGMIKNSS